MDTERHGDLILNHISELQGKYPGLKLLLSDDSRAFVVRGNLAFFAQYDGMSIEDDYEVEIIIPKDYPATPPKAKEIGGKIPKNFHLNNDGTLCLGVPIEVKRKFYKKRSLLGFVEVLLIPFLYSHRFEEIHREMPYGELPHGIEGILKYYKELFGVDDDYAVLVFLKILAEDNYRGHLNCPCGSNNKLRNCHGKILLELKELQGQTECLYEYLYIIKFMSQKGQNIPKALIPSHILKKIRNTSEWEQK